MSTRVANPIQHQQRAHLVWVLQIYSNPRRVFEQLADQSRWVLPIVFIIIAAFANVLATGNASTLNPPPLIFPEGWEYFSPEQQAQFMRSVELTSGPVFTYVFPIAFRVIGIFSGWAIYAGLIHLMVTLIGGRATARITFALAAWALMPFALRSIVRTVAILSSRAVIVAPGISGFAPVGEGVMPLLMMQAMTHIDLYAAWAVGLVFIGLQVIDPSLPKGRSWVLVGAATLIMWFGLIALGFAGAQLGSLSVMRPFFF